MTIMAAFYKQKPRIDTPYRQLIIECGVKGEWRVCLSGGTKWGAGHSGQLEVLPANTFDEAMTLYNKVFGQLQIEGWKPYSPDERW